ncbi:2-oxoacid:acceptor oxidoreductase family protein [Abyssisolibacter fermentans]|uniref:2-oxoacid:acceptor oxidoreductase family protein n=1 Tax=Abyssisolibacter fermentans TaxID=1766203 RepID=UPI00083743FD|nr:2-oxoacid:acceptor oxidoreductase family protein [Abyssisolibacter fermentans]
MVNQKEIRLSGSGGQGLILAGIILAEAAILDGKNTIQSQSYGPEARGGASKAEVIISDNVINYPKVRNCDLMLSLTQVACDKYLSQLNEGGILIIDDSIEEPNRNDITIYRLPIIKTAATNIGRIMVSNIVALGALNGISNLVNENSLKKAILNRVPRGTENLNENAFNAGLQLAKAL